MNLKRFNEFVQELTDDAQLKKSLGALKVYRHFRESWYRDDGSGLEANQLIKRLSFIRALDSPSRRPNETGAFFPVSSLDAVVVASFPAKPNSATRQKIQKQIASCLKRSSDAYRARHDELTELLNRSAFDGFLIEKLEQLTTPLNIMTDVDDQSGLDFNSIILLTLDIDFFKRVNDSYGHAYGDIVLRSFAIRVENASQNLKQISEYRMEIYPARLGGEEFAVLVVRDVRPAAELDIGEFLRHAITARPVPDDSELCVIGDDPRLSGITLPPIAERAITASIGLSSQHGGIVSGTGKVRAERLKTEADQALYRAKALGRNRCVRFSDIVQKHGQVIEHHVDVEVVAIDLGREVGVSIGQEFLVFHPDFTGSKPFIFGDGRSERRLGDYPRVPSGRLEVFDVQPEISFSYVAEKRGIERFPRGALLEAVPVGSIAHLIAKDWWQWLNLPSLASKQEDVDRELRKIDPWDAAAIACIRLANKEKLLTSRGAGLVNRIYASLYSELTNTFKGEVVAQIATETFSVVIRNDPVKMEERLKEVSKKCEELYDSLPQIGIGFFSQTEAVLEKESEAAHASQIPFEHGLTCARLALELSVRRQERFVVFDADAAGELLGSLRASKEYEAFDDSCEMVREIGLKDARIEAEMAAVAFYRGKHDDALKIIDEAINLKSDWQSLKLNKAAFLVASGNGLAAAEMFGTISPRKDEADIYRTARILADYAKFQSDPEQMDPHQLAKALEDIRSSRSLGLLGFRSSDVALALMRVRSK